MGRGRSRETRQWHDLTGSTLLARAAARRFHLRCVGLAHLLGVGTPALTSLPARHLCRQRFQLRRPEVAESIEPEMHAAHGLGAHGVDATRGIDAHSGETAFPKHLQMLRHGRLSHTELRLDDMRHVARGALAIGEQLQEASANRVSENLECVH